MATRARATTPLLFLLLATGLLCAAAVASSREEGRGGERSLQRCVRRCEEDRPLYERARCVQECREEQQRHQRQGRHEHGREEESRRPYVFGWRSFRRVVRSEQGFVKALRPFHEASKLLRGIRDYRVVILEANPSSFVVPSHSDAHCICYVAQGEGVVTTIENGEKRSYTIREGHVFVAPAGAVTYLANTDGRRKLVIAKILHTISVPGKFQYFFGPGGRNPESFLSSFSKRVQRAAYRTSDDRLERLLGRQGKGIIVRASEEQARELRRHASEGGHGPHSPLPPFGESRGPFNLLEQRPKLANRHGRLYEANARTFHDLAEHDVRVSLVNITAGSMSAPFYNTRSTMIAVVVDGEGEVEIVCPHQQAHGGDSERRRGGGQGEHGKGKWREEEEEEQEQEHEGEEQEQEHEGEEQEQEARQGYHTIRARLSRGTVFVVPVGHPVVEVASRGSNLQIVCFEVRAEKNDRVYLAGTNNVLKKLDRAAKELAFAASETEVDEVLNAQPEEGFLPGPEESSRSHGKGQEEEQEEEGRRHRGHEEAETFLRMVTGVL